METINREPVSYSASDLEQKTIKGLIPAVSQALKSKYRLLINGEEVTTVDPFEIIAKSTSGFKDAIGKSSKRTKKRLLNRINGFERGVSLKKINTFLQFLRTKVMADTKMPTYKFIVSSQEQEIVDMRVKYKALRTETEKVYQEYKTKKRAFYPQGKQAKAA